MTGTPNHPASSDELKVGDHVKITGSVPWTGFTGTIIEPFTRSALDWVVEIEGEWAGQCTAQAARNLRRVTVRD